MRRKGIFSWRLVNNEKVKGKYAFIERKSKIPAPP